MHKRFAVLTAVLASATALMAQHERVSSAASQQDLLQVQAKRFQAMMSQDVKTLNTMVADELTYCHTTAAVNTKAV